MSDLTQFTDATFKEEVLDSNVPVLVDFWAVWCAPCLAIGPIVEQIAEEYKEKLKVGKLNVDDNPNTSTQYGIRSIPTLLIFKNGLPVEQIIGAVPKNQIVKKMEKYL